MRMRGSSALISEKLEPWRITHTGNVFDLVFFETEKSTSQADRLDEEIEPFGVNRLFTARGNGRM
jgi:hypothetical protein